MKIAHSSIILGLAGSEKYLLDLLPALNKKEDVSVSFVALVPKSRKGSEKEFVDQLRSSDVDVHIVYYGRAVIGGVFRLNRILKSLNADIIHTHLLHADFFAALVKRLLNKRIKHVSTKHGYEETYNNEHGFDPSFKVKNKYWRVAKWSEKKITKSYAVSKGIQNLFIGLGICNKDKLDVVYHGFDFNFPERSKPKNETARLVMVGRLTAFKGHRYAIEACAELKKMGVDFHFDIIGSGELDGELKNLVDEKNLGDQVSFLGHQAEAYRRMIDSEVVLIPSVAEGFGVVVLEAMAAKTPIVGFDVPAINELLINNETGLLVAPYDITEYAMAIHQLLENQGETARMVQSAHRQLINYYSLDRMVSETVAFYQSI